MACVVPFTSAKDDAHVIVFPWIGDVRQVLVRTVEINVVVVIAVEKWADIERAAQADEMTDGVGMTKSNIGSVIGTKTGSADCHTMAVTFAAREIEHVAHDDVFVRVMGPHPVGWMNRFIVKTVQIYRVRAIDR